jgi:lysophospholipase L1-like esterase
MADKALQNLTAAISLAASDTFYVEQGTSSRRGTLQQLIDLINGTPAVPVVALAAGVSQSEGNSGTTNFVFTVNRTGSLAGSSSVSWAVTGSGSNPANAADFVGGVLPSGSITFGVGVSAASINVAVAGDTTVEPTENFTVTLSSPVNATIGAATATGTIVTDDSSSVTLPRLSAAIATVQAGTGRACIACVGDSVTNGWGSSVVTGDGVGNNPPHNTIRMQSWPNLMQAKFAAAGVPTRSDAVLGFSSGAYPNGGSNSDLIIQIPWISITGATQANGVPAAGGQYLSFAPGNSMTFTPQANANRFDIYTSQASGLGTLTVTDATGTLATINLNGATTASIKTTVTRTANDTSPITITCSGNTCYLAGIIPYSTTNRMLEIWNMGHPGSTATNWLSNTAGYDTFTMLQTIIAGAHLVTIELGLNDSHQGISASTFQSNLQAIITGIYNSSLRDLLLIKPHDTWSGGSDHAYNLSAAMRTAIDTLVTNNSLRPAIDLRALTYTEPTDFYDTVHLAKNGYANQSTAIYNNIAAQI